MSTSTVEIVAGTSERTSRLSLKRAMSAFGEVDACHMGDRAVMGDRFTEFPIVRFKIQSSADAALAALKAGQVFLDGMQLQGEWRGGGGLAVRQRLKPPERRNAPVAPQSQIPGEDEMSSRALIDPSSNRDRDRQQLDSHNTFTGRDQRRGDPRDGGYSSRRIADAPARGRSRSRRRRSPSKKRKQSRSRSRSERKRGSNPLIADKVGKKPVKSGEESVFGNVESEMSDNPLFVPKS